MYPRRTRPDALILRSRLLSLHQRQFIEAQLPSEGGVNTGGRCFLNLEVLTRWTLLKDKALRAAEMCERQSW